MDEYIPFASRTYALLFLLLLISRGMDFLSTWVATPNMVLEGNPLAKKLGWKWGIPLNLALCFGFALWPLPAIVISTTSVLVAARNFQSAWLMRSLGEQLYREWHVERVQETSVTLYLFCLFAQTALTAIVGAAVVYFGGQQHIVLLAIGLGIIAYACAVAFYTLLGIWRMRRASLRDPATAWRLSEPGMPNGGNIQPLNSGHPADASPSNPRRPLAERAKLLDVTPPTPIQPQRQ
jgi:heme A synthase